MCRLEIEELLIKSVHSDEDAVKLIMSSIHDEKFFYTILDVVENSDSGDARMEGAYYISKCDLEMLRKEENRLLKLMNDGWQSVEVHIMIALSRIKSTKALMKIIECRIRPTLQWEAEALMNYFQGVSNER